MKKFVKILKRSFIEGLIFFIPVAVVIWVIFFLFRKLYGLFHFSLFFLPLQIRTLPFIKPVVTLLTIFIVLFFIFLVGLIINSFIGKSIKSTFDKLFSLIPIFGTFYSSLKQLSSLLLREKVVNFSSVVLVEFPHSDSWCIGFLTSEIDKNKFQLIDKSSEEFYAVFVPTSPNPMTGFTIIVKKEKIRKIDISVEEALKFVVFLGLISEREE